jgi:hypothetical protein
MRFLNNIIAVFLLALCTLSNSKGLAASAPATADKRASIDQKAQTAENDQRTNAFRIHQQGETALTILERISPTLSVEESNDQNNIGAAQRTEFELPGSCRYYLSRAVFKSGRLQKLLFPFHTHL